MLLGCDASIRYELTNFNKGWLFNILIIFLNYIYMVYKYTFIASDKKNIPDTDSLRRMEIGI